MTEARPALGIIPARAQSTRFPNKVLAKIDGLPMIQHVWQRAMGCARFTEVIVATDDDSVVETVRKFGGSALITPAHLPSGSDRVAYASRERTESIVVNVQGDEPLISSLDLERLVDALTSDPQTDIATLVFRSGGNLGLSDPNTVKVVTDVNNYALYFSRSPLAIDSNGGYLKHIGIYGYKTSVLRQLCEMSPSKLEIAERLEQLRALEHGFKIKVVETTQDTIAVDVPEDIGKVERFLRKKT